MYVARTTQFKAMQVMNVNWWLTNVTSWGRSKATRQLAPVILVVMGVCGIIFLYPKTPLSVLILLICSPATQ